MVRGEEKVLFVGSSHWPVGLLGLIASKLVHHFSLPAFVWGGDGERVKGSVRSSTIPLTYFMEQGSFPESCEFGGHREAGGFSCAREDLQDFENEIRRLVEEWNCSHSEEEIIIPLDMELGVEAIQQEFYEQVRQLAPFGVGNEKPIFLVKDVFIEYAGEFGKEKDHFELRFRNRFGKSVRGIAFFRTRTSFPEIRRGEPYDLVAQVEYSVFRGRHEFRLRVVDLFPSGRRNERIVG